MRAGILTISDKGAKGERIDETGIVLKKMLMENNFSIAYYNIVPDEIQLIEKELVYLCDELKVELILTNGGTGFSKRDITPEATKNIIEKYVPGIGEVMRLKSVEITPKAMLSRGIAGIRKDSLIINLPGSPLGASENFSFILPALHHGLEILLGESTECAREKLEKP